MAKTNHLNTGSAPAALATLALATLVFGAVPPVAASDLFAAWVSEADTPPTAESAALSGVSSINRRPEADLSDCWTSTGFAPHMNTDTRAETKRSAPTNQTTLAHFHSQTERRAVSGERLGFDFGPETPSVEPAVSPARKTAVAGGAVALATDQQNTFGFESAAPPIRRAVKPLQPVVESREPRSFAFTDAPALPEPVLPAPAPAVASSVAPESDLASFLAPDGVSRGEFVADSQAKAPVWVAARPNQTAQPSRDPASVDASLDSDWHSRIASDVVNSAADSIPTAPTVVKSQVEDRLVASVPTEYATKPQPPVARVAAVTGTHTELVTHEPGYTTELPLAAGEVIYQDVENSVGGCYADPYACRQSFRYDRMLGAQPLQTLSIDTRARIKEGDKDGEDQISRIADESDLNSTYVVTDGMDNPISFVPYGSAASIATGCSRFDATYSYYWLAPSLFHRPLYFEQPNAERYGHYLHGDCVQSAVSAAHFFGSVAILPYKMGASPHQACDYTLGRYRPGSCNPRRLTCEALSVRGAVYQGLTVTGLVFLIP